MKTKGLILLSLVFLCISCDISTRFIIDGKKEYILSGECGTIKIKGSTFMSSVMVSSVFDGRYHVDTDSLKIEALSNEDTISDIHFWLDHEDVTGKKIEMKGGEVLALHFTLRSVLPNQGVYGNILLLPSNFITCEGRPIIIDTIRIQLKMRGQIGLKRTLVE